MQLSVKLLNFEAVKLAEMIIKEDFLLSLIMV